MMGSFGRRDWWLTGQSSPRLERPGTEGRVANDVTGCSRTHGSNGINDHRQADILWLFGVHFSDKSGPRKECNWHIQDTQQRANSKRSLLRQPDSVPTRCCGARNKKEFSFNAAGEGIRNKLE